MKEFLKRLRPGDGIVLLTVLLLAGVLSVVFLPRGVAQTAVVSVDGREVLRRAFPAWERHELENGLVIRFDGSRVRVESSPCPDQICVNTGWLSQGGQRAVCLPFRTVLELRGEKESVITK